MKNNFFPNGKWGIFGNPCALKKTFAAHLAPVKNICLNKNFRAYFRKGKYIAEDRAFFAGFLSDFKM